MRKDILEKVMRFYKDRLAFYASIKEDALAKAKEECEDIVTLENEIKNIKLLALQGKLTVDDDKRYDELRAKYKELIKPYIPNIKYECPICKDTGVVNNKFCSCFKNRYMKELKVASNLNSLPTFKFEDNSIDTKNIDDEIKSKYKQIYTFFEDYADTYPNVAKRNITITGKPGCGKSYILSAVSNRLSERGIVVQYLTAFELGELFLRSHLNYKDDSLKQIMDVDVLIIDDLGTEPIREKINRDYLQSILDSRMISKKATIITTNLTPQEIAERYGKRIASRVRDKDIAKCFMFESLPDLRTK